MSFVPDPSLYHDNKMHTKKMMQEYYQSALTQVQSLWSQAQIDRRFANGNRMNSGGLGILGNGAGQQYNNQKFIFNLLHSYKQMVLGHQMRTRKSSIVVPVHDKDQQLADDKSEVLMWTMRQDDMLNKISNIVDELLTTGLCFAHNYMDYRDDPIDGILRIRPYAITECIFDPWWRERDLTDCRFFWTRDYVSLKQLAQLLPDYDKQGKFQTYGAQDMTLFNFMPESYQVMRAKRDNYAYDQFYYASEKTVKLIHSYDRDETYEFPGDKESRDMWIDMTFSNEEKRNLKTFTHEKACVNIAIAVNGRVVYDEYLDDFYPFTAFPCYMDVNETNYQYRFYGIIRPARDSQYLYDRRMNIQLDVLETLPTSGIYVREDALIDKNDAFKSGPGQITPINSKYAPQEAVMNMMPPQIDTSALKMTDDLRTLSRDIMGISEELMGMADGDVGIVEMLRQGASLTTLQSIFNNIDCSQKMLSRALLRKIEREYTFAKVTRILGHKPSNEFFNTNFMRFDCAIEDGLNTTTQKQMQFAQMLQLMEKGVPISPEDLLEASTLQNKTQIIENMQKKLQSQQKMEEQKAQSEMMVAQANTKLLESQAYANESTGHERMSRINENEMFAVERKAQAQSDIANATFKQAETLRKIQEIDISNLQKLIEAMEHLQKLNNPQLDQGVVNAQ